MRKWLTALVLLAAAPLLCAQTWRQTYIPTDQGLTMPDAYAVVRDDCAGAEAPCFTTICDRAAGGACAAGSALDWVFDNDANAGDGLRVVDVYAKPDGTAYDEDIACCYDGSAGGTSSSLCTVDGSGHTVIRGVLTGGGWTVGTLDPRVIIEGVADASDDPTFLAADCSVENLELRMSSDTANEPTFAVGAGAVGAVTVSDAVIVGNTNLKSIGAGSVVIDIPATSGAIAFARTDAYAIAINPNAATTLLRIDTSGNTVGLFEWHRGRLSLDRFSGGANTTSTIQLISTWDATQFFAPLVACNSPFTCIEWDDDNVNTGINGILLGQHPTLQHGRLLGLTDINTDDGLTSILKIGDISGYRRSSFDEDVDLTANTADAVLGEDIIGWPLGDESHDRIQFCGEMPNATNHFGGPNRVSQLTGAIPTDHTLASANCNALGDAVIGNVDDAIDADIGYRAEKLFCKVSAAPGAAATFTLMDDTAATDLACSIGTADTSCSSEVGLHAYLTGGSLAAVRATTTTDESAEDFLCFMYLTWY